ncbi:hypothetical protein PIB30_042773 [Stylosanthes scabra]|uniref:F-box associated domain-containing protein n=1 Tax=Stylosanthes scabra TaxID=79078 RepID=A0ABU6YE73_9FABA|nr:hypothetical protein [Stylosanthes scabra]
MGDSSWRDMGIFPTLPLSGLTSNENDGIYIAGTLNWLALRNFRGDNVWQEVTSVDQLVIVSLDLGEETYKQFGLPDGLDELPKLKPVLGVLRDCLYLCHDYKTPHFVLWQMNEFGNAASWTQLLNVTYQHLQLDRFYLDEGSHPLMPMCMSEKGDVVVLLSTENLAPQLQELDALLMVCWYVEESGALGRMKGREVLSNFLFQTLVLLGRVWKETETGKLRLED